MNDLPTTMRAAFIREPGPAEAIEIGILPIPDLGPTDILVKNIAMAVNHVDTFVRSGAYKTHTPFPFIVGRDLVGTVAATGPGVTTFQPGDSVWCNSLGHDGRQGSFAEYAVVASDRLYNLPETVNPLDAVGILHTAATAHIGLFREAKIKPGETIFVAGAAGGVGSAVVQMAAAAGARVIASASDRDVQWCLSCGADEVIDYRDPQLWKRIADAAPQGVDIWWDNSGHHEFDLLFPLLSKGARVIVMAGLGAKPVLPVGGLYTRDASLHGFVISNASTSELADAATMINHLLQSKRLASRVGVTLPLNETVQAHRKMENHAPGGRIVVIP
ncbi:NADPH:quinone reductase-like Zn-dependent oxidoreductase [Pseudarthrobacter sp. W1I19]|uniref:NADPH:quinone reductase n=1 Tax=Pseudarthrobacter sp. W1I19 TaxID=3042288 RepID=UPI002781339C|nr:NADPH:quinone reductase [Pseudarthrobacter sp. W1I19]MDQ0925656.1 NADPH:quinone reductase-like Zn-dependent oxidoreductase [Pseudarthrobacter sp. W1I19]